MFIFSKFPHIPLDFPISTPKVKRKKKTNKKRTCFSQMLMLMLAFLVQLERWQTSRKINTYDCHKVHGSEAFWALQKPNVNILMPACIKVWAERPSWLKKRWLCVMGNGACYMRKRKLTHIRYARRHTRTHTHICIIRMKRWYYSTHLSKRQPVKCVVAAK